MVRRPEILLFFSISPGFVVLDGRTQEAAKNTLYANLVGR